MGIVEREVFLMKLEVPFNLHLFTRFEYSMLLYSSM